MRRIRAIRLAVIMLAGVAVAAVVGLGFHLAKPARDHLDLATAQLHTLAFGIQAFADDTGSAPERLDELLESTVDGRGPYVRGEPLRDPWGTPVVFARQGSGGFVLTSLGADGRPGGSGPARDRTLAGEIDRR